ncbi:MAG: 2-amino-4-hydroxy-6-hydroxymethyldihydropteridine diphosphokinase, partial [Burkholderiaceae bacterium]
MSDRVFIGLGANLGDPRRAIDDALDALAARPDVRLTDVSSLYRSAPVDADGPDFINAVARVDTTLTPDALLQV